MKLPTTVLVRPRRGLTFFEITVVFIIIAILAVLAYFATQRLTVQTQLARVREEHRVLSRALQNYYVDQYDFPSQMQGLMVLNAPITYLASIPIDVFARGVDKGQPYAYRTWNSQLTTVWLLVSRGPDGDIDLDNPPTDGAGAVLSSNSVPNFEAFPEALQLMSYDPTNGLRSNGDVYALTPFVRN